VLLHELVRTSAAVAKASSRLVKIAELAALLQRVTLAEVDIAVAFLSGELPHGRIGIGASVIREAKPPSAASSPVLSLIEVENVFEQIARTSGRGSSRTGSRGSASTPPSPGSSACPAPRQPTWPPPAP